jgi:hypothetical protein
MTMTRAPSIAKARCVRPRAVSSSMAGSRAATMSSASLVVRVMDSGNCTGSATRPHYPKPLRSRKR